LFPVSATVDSFPDFSVPSCSSSRAWIRECPPQTQCSAPPPHSHILVSPRWFLCICHCFLLWICFLSMLALCPASSDSREFHPSIFRHPHRVVSCLLMLGNFYVLFLAWGSCMTAFSCHSGGENLNVILHTHTVKALPWNAHGQLFYPLMWAKSNFCFPRLENSFSASGWMDRQSSVAPAFMQDVPIQFLTSQWSEACCRLIWVPPTFSWLHL
jgi:hypothetical protein